MVRSCYSQRHVTTKRDGHCDAFDKTIKQFMHHKVKPIV